MSGANRVWAGAALWLLAAACAPSDESDIFTEVIPLARGEFYQLSWSGTQQERFWVMAQAGTPAKPSGAIMLISPENAEPCRLDGAPGTRYLRPLQPRTAGKYVVGSPSPARVFMFGGVDADGVGTLDFADIHCQRQAFSVPDVRDLWYLMSPDQTTLSVAVRTRDDALDFVDPWKGERRTVAQGVTALATYDTGETLIENGRLVQRDRRGQELLRRGKAVTDFWHLGGQGDVAYRDGRALHVRRDGAEKRLSDDGCDVGTLDPFVPGALVFNAPCVEDEPRALHVAVGDQIHRYAEGVSALFAETGLLLYTKDQDDSTQLWLVRSGMPSQPQMIAELPQCSLSDVGSLGPGRLFLKANMPDETITVWQLELSQKPVLTPLASGLLGLSATSNAFAILTADAELLVSDRPDASRVSWRVPNARRSRYTFMFSGKTTALAYLSNVDEETRLGRLELHFLSGQHYVLGDDVREFQQVWWPERGILFAAGGEKAGVYFARVDIPCESASETAWACGF